MVVGLASLSATVATWNASLERNEHELRAYFDYRVRDASRRIAARLAMYQEILRAVKGHLLTAKLSRSSFRRFVDALQLEQRFPGIQGVGFSVVVPKAAKAAHEAEIRAEGFPAYAIKPPGERDPYSAIVFLEPFSGRNLRAFGFDMYSERVRRRAMELAHRLDDMTISGHVTLVQETDTDVQVGFLMYVPVFEENGGAVAPLERRLKGWAYSPFRMKDFMSGVLGEQAGDLDIEIFDGPQTTSEMRMFHSAEGHAAEVNGSFVATRELDVGHHVWTLVVRALPGFEARLGADPTRAIALGGSLGSVLLILLVYVLVTGRARAAALAAEKEGRYQQLVQGASDAVLVIALDGRILEANSRATEHFGYSLAELLTMRVFELYAGDAVGAAKARFEELIAKGKMSFETRHRRKNGSEVESEVSARIVDLAGNRTVLSLTRDISERKRADERVRRSEALFRRMFESHAAVMLLIDPTDGSLVDANAAAARYYGYEREVLRTMNLGQLNALSPEALRRALDDAASGARSHFQFPHRLSDGTVRTVEVHSSLVEFSGRVLIFSIVQDITERLRAEAELSELNRELAERVRASVDELRAKDQLLITQNRLAAMGEMIGNIAHQWRQPLNVMSLVLANLRDAVRHGELDAEVVEKTVDDANRIVQKMSSTISDFRDFFRPDKAPSVFLAREQVDAAIGLVSASFSHARITLQIDESSEARLRGYPNEYSQVLLNLLTNAKEAIQSKGRTGEVHLRIYEKDGFGCVSIRDTGGGIAPELADKIFEPYFSTKEMGTGIGLYMSKQIIERNMGGRVEVHNVDGGAEFVVAVPLVEA